TPTAAAAPSGAGLSGKPSLESKPASMLTRALTRAKIARSIKNRDILGAASFVAGETKFGLQLNIAGRNRIDLHAGPHPMQTFGDHLFACLNAITHQPGIAQGT